MKIKVFCWKMIRNRRLRDVMVKSVLSYSLWKDSLLSSKQLFIQYSSDVYMLQGRVGMALHSVLYSTHLKDYLVARTLGNLLSFPNHYGHIKYFLAADLK